MKCSNEISRQRNDYDYHFKGTVTLIFFNGFVFVAKPYKPNKFERSLACDVYFVCTSRKTQSHEKKIKLVVCFSPIENTYSLLLL